MRLFCDEMLARLGRWLRAAGHDTAIARPGEDDCEIVARARRENRLLITRDRAMAARAAASGRIVVLAGNDLESQASELTLRLGVDWLAEPFSRCLVCNVPLAPGDDGKLARVPPFSRERVERLRYCPRCDRVVWDGSHVRRMRRKLARWQAGEWRCGGES